MTTGIIAEYNPFHNGHKYMLKQIREQFPQEPIIICLSGSITQRGEIALVVCGSKAEVASSHNRIFGSLAKALAIPTRCLSGC